MDLADAFDKFLAEVDDDPRAIHEICETERRKRNGESREKLLGPDFKGVRVDSILASILTDPTFTDPRNNLCIWVRPTKAILAMVARTQEELRAIEPGQIPINGFPGLVQGGPFVAQDRTLADLAIEVWLTPQSALHMTLLEIVHSETEENVNDKAQKLRPTFPYIIDHGINAHVELGNPQLNYDEGTVSITFVPNDARKPTYLHLRRDLAKLCKKGGVEVRSRYFTTSSHMTLARFTNAHQLADERDRETWIQKIESLNRWLSDEYGRVQTQCTTSAWKWVVGSESGIKIRKGRLWYGGGETITVQSGPTREVPDEY